MHHLQAASQIEMVSQTGVGLFDVAEAFESLNRLRIILLRLSAELALDQARDKVVDRGKLFFGCIFAGAIVKVFVDFDLGAGEHGHPFRGEVTGEPIIWLGFAMLNSWRMVGAMFVGAGLARASARWRR